MIEFKMVVARKQYLIQALDGEPALMIRVFRESPKRLKGQEVASYYFSTYEWTAIQRQARFLMDSPGKPS